MPASRSRGCRSLRPCELSKIASTRYCIAVPDIVLKPMKSIGSYADRLTPAATKGVYDVLVHLSAMSTYGSTMQHDK
ncbi:hypothetical protein BCAR13_40038 [Paraburkholderia caribensis]|nr:hypothetical protein BCAR13_40038 [Paraburkholderia caribensis]